MKNAGYQSYTMKEESVNNLNIWPNVDDARCKVACTLLHGISGPCQLSLFLSFFHSVTFSLGVWYCVVFYLQAPEDEAQPMNGGGPLHLHSENQSAQCRLAGTSSPINVILVSSTNYAKPSRSSYSYILQCRYTRRQCPDRISMSYRGHEKSNFFLFIYI